jgi:hypothetical protein
MTNNNLIARNSLIACELGAGEAMFADWRHDQWANILKAHVQWLVTQKKLRLVDTMDRCSLSGSVR